MRAPLYAVRKDVVRESSAGLYLSSPQQWTPWLRSQVGVRADGYRFGVEADLDANSGDTNDRLLTPKLALVLGSRASTRVFLNWGHGVHSNGASGVLNRVDPVDEVLEVRQSNRSSVRAVAGFRIRVGLRRRRRQQRTERCQLATWDGAG